jgi:hypothetical protein
MWLEYVKKYKEENGNTPLKTIAEDYRAKGFGKPKVPKPPALKACELRVKLVQLGYDLCKPAVNKAGKDYKKSLTVKEMKAMLTAHENKPKEKVEVAESPPLPEVKKAKKPKVAPEEPVKMGELGRSQMSELQQQEYDMAITNKDLKLKRSFEKAFPGLKKPKKSKALQ